MRETIAVFGAALLGASALTWGGVARAQQTAPFFTVQNDPSAPGLTHPDVGYGMEDYYKRGLPAPTQAFELKLGTGLHPGLRDDRSERRHPVGGRGRHRRERRPRLPHDARTLRSAWRASTRSSRPRTTPRPAAPWATSASPFTAPRCSARSMASPRPRATGCSGR